jgi:hypothetical protein
MTISLKTEVQKLDEELGNDYKTKEQVYRAMTRKAIFFRVLFSPPDRERRVHFELP